MIDNAYLIWFIATAIMTITVLTVGTLAAAGLLTRKQHEGRPPAAHELSERSAPHHHRPPA